MKRRTCDGRSISKNWKPRWVMPIDKSDPPLQSVKKKQDTYFFIKPESKRTFGTHVPTSADTEPTMKCKIAWNQRFLKEKYLPALWCVIVKKIYVLWMFVNSFWTKVAQKLCASKNHKIRNTTYPPNNDIFIESWKVLFNRQDPRPLLLSILCHIRSSVRSSRAFRSNSWDPFDTQPATIAFGIVWSRKRSRITKCLDSSWSSL